MEFDKTPHFVMGLLLIDDPGEEDTDSVDVIFHIRCLVIEDDNNLSFGAEHMFLALPPHVPFPLLFCRSRILVFIPEDPHDDTL